MKYREMRLKKKEITDTNIVNDILMNGEYGTMSTVGEDNQPYGIPVNYVVHDNNIYFHCAMKGHKIDNIRYNNKVSFSVVGRSKVIPEQLSTDYQSINVFGKATEVYDTEEKKTALINILEKYTPKQMDMGLSEIEKLFKATMVIKITIDHITGKGR